jgi:hypothetical protein
MAAKMKPHGGQRTKIKIKRLNNKSLGAKVIQEMVRKTRSKDYLFIYCCTLCSFEIIVLFVETLKFSSIF